MEEFKGNFKPEPKPAEKRVDGPVVTNAKVKKESSLASKFFAQDLKSTGKGVTNDILIPGVKNLVVNVLKKAVDYMFLGSFAPSNNSYVNYGGVYNTTARNVSYAPGFNPTTYGTTPVASRPTIYAVNEVVFPDRGQAEEVLARMTEIIKSYGMVSVRDFYDLINQNANHTDNKYGWRDLSSAMVVRGSDGYRIQFPKVIPLE